MYFTFNASHFRIKERSFEFSINCAERMKFERVSIACDGPAFDRIFLVLNTLFDKLTDGFQFQFAK